jgi:hypothetical protein
MLLLEKKPLQNWDASSSLQTSPITTSWHKHSPSHGNSITA